MTLISRFPRRRRAPGRIDVPGEIGERFPGAGLGESNSLLDLFARRTIDVKKLRLCQHPLVFQSRRKGVNRPPRLPLLDLGLVAVEFRVEHRMRAEAVRLELDEHRPLARS